MNCSFIRTYLLACWLIKCSYVAFTFFIWVEHISAIVVLFRVIQGRPPVRCWMSTGFTFEYIHIIDMLTISWVAIYSQSLCLPFINVWHWNQYQNTTRTPQLHYCIIYSIIRARCLVVHLHSSPTIEGQ